ncbi:MAG: flagellar protein FliB [Clostridium sulfidigenes]|uniref:Flagellar protein FliB n=1 Tax=Clostridium sulfidigenes TaxID=318464 RepID=A0A927W485_9CLOT|nr:flagellar protein FliB [Clostridium sulfidigenes]
MKIRVPKYLNKFKCIAGKCEDTCCAGWEIVIDEETYDYYENLSGSFGERLRSEMVNDGEDNIFVLKNGNCAFLNENKLCDIYNELGEDSLCYTCKKYPRYMEEFGNLREIGISLSCPEAARIILGDSNKVEFELSENDEFITSYNDIDAMLFIDPMQCRSIIFNILQNRSIDLNIRAAIILDFAKEVQDKIDEDDLTSLKTIKERYMDKNFINNTSSDLDKNINNKEQWYTDIEEYFYVFKGLKHINNNDPLGLDKVLFYIKSSAENKDIYLDKYKEFKKFYKDNMYKFENILVYFVFRYFMKSVFDYDVAAKVKTAVVSYLIIKQLCVVRWIESGDLSDEDIVDISHTYSKDIEHLEENIDTLADIFKMNPVFREDRIINILINFKGV